MKLTKETIKKLRKSSEAILAIMTASKKSYTTVCRWLDNNDEHLTTASCLKAICKVLNCAQEDILQQEKA